MFKWRQFHLFFGGLTWKWFQITFLLISWVRCGYNNIYFLLYFYFRCYFFTYFLVWLYIQAFTVGLVRCFNTGCLEMTSLHSAKDGKVFNMMCRAKVFCRMVFSGVVQYITGPRNNDKYIHDGVYDKEFKQIKLNGNILADLAIYKSYNGK